MGRQLPSHGHAGAAHPRLQHVDREQGILTGSGTVPGWVGESHTCAECGFAFGVTDVADVPDGCRDIRVRVRDLVSGSAERLRARPDDGTWTALEYLCHLRDVYVASTIRLYRARTEDRPQLEPVFNDLRAVRFGYNQHDPSAVLSEIDAAVNGCIEEMAHVQDWTRPVVRRPGEERTARWLARAALHEGQHHRLDMQRLLATRD